MQLGFIGCGKMATALIEGVVGSGVFAKSEIVVSDRYPAAVEAVVAKCGVRQARDNAEVAGDSDVIVSCVKPADAAEALAAVKNAGVSKLVISIMAGVPISKLQELSGPKARIIRVMPNTPALVHKGAAAYALGEGTTDADAGIVEKIFSAVGTVARVKESLLDAVTGLSGSGPAYIYLIIEALSDSGVLMGLPRDLSLQLAAQTVAGAAEMVLKTGLHPAVLKEQVTSPGGTTIAGIAALEEAGVRAAFLSAVRVATERSLELGAPAK
jgi:pyrroline-5-carboxylate reductase